MTTVRQQEQNPKIETMSLFLRSLFFTILQPGMAAGLIPYWISSKILPDPKNANANSHFDDLNLVKKLLVILF